MIKLLQDLFPWLATLPFTAKLLISVAVVVVAGAVLVMIWTPPQSNTKLVEPQPTPPELIKTEPSPIVTASPGPVETPTPPKPMWPQDKSFEGLKRRLDRTSKTNRKILLALLDAGRDGLYVSANQDSLAARFNLSRNDVLARGAELQRLQLIEVIELTDRNYRLNEDVLTVVGPNGLTLLRTLLK